MEETYQTPAQNTQWYNKAHSYRKRVQRRNFGAAASNKTRAFLIIDGAYFEQGTASYLNENFGINLFDTIQPEVLVENFVNALEENLQVQWVHRYFITALFDENPAHQYLLANQYAMIEALEQKWNFKIDCREFKTMSVYCPNKNWYNSARPIHRRVQAEVDVAIATKALTLAFQDKYDVLIAIAGDRDFKDWYSAIISESNKQVKILGFTNSIWHGYYDVSLGIEVYEAEYLWNMAIGKSLLSKPREVPQVVQPSIPDEESKSVPRKPLAFQPEPALKQRELSQNPVRNYNFQVKSKRKKRMQKHKSYKYKTLSFNTAVETKEAEDKKSSYFDQISLKTKEDIMSHFNVDSYTAELALYITDGNMDACKKYIQQLDL